MPQKHRLRAVRISHGKTQKLVGQESGVSSSTISDIECHRGPDVDLSEWRPTRTKAMTIVKLVVALGCIPPGDYSVEELIAMAKERRVPFAANEIYEAVRYGLVQPSRRGELSARQPRSNRKPAQRGHLRAVA